MLVASLLPVLLGAGNRLLPNLNIPSLFGLSPLVYLPILMIVVGFGLGTLIAQSWKIPDYGWKLGLILAAWLVSLSVVALGEFKLGVDLQGGVILVYEKNIEATEALDAGKKGVGAKMEGVAQILSKRLNPDGLKELVIRPFGENQIEVIIPEVDATEVSRIKRLITEVGSLKFMIVAEDEKRDFEVIEAAQIQSQDESEKRLSLLVKDTDGSTVGFWARADREGTVGPVWERSFRDSNLCSYVLRDGGTGKLIPQSLTRQLRSSDALLKYCLGNDIRQVDVLMVFDEENQIQGEDLANATAMSQLNSNEIHFEMTPAGGRKMGLVTGNNLPTATGGTRKLGIVYDNSLVSAPSIQSRIQDRGQITGQFTREEVDFMVETLKSGSMPVVLRKDPISENQIGSTLGRDTINKGSRAIAFSLLLVIAFVLVYYQFSGLIACLALVLNILLTVMIMLLLGAPFTLPGLAGLVLTVGMSVDSNVLIYERIREELAKGAGLRMALRNGFDRAMTTIIDSNLTTVLTAFVLYYIGTDQVKGFGVTLMLGILTSMFTAIFCARVIFEVGERTRLLTGLKMYQFFEAPSIDWVKLFPPATIASIVLIVIGLGATIARGTGILDTDLVGGTSVTMTLKEPQTDADVRKKLGATFEKLIADSGGKRFDFNVYEVQMVGQPQGTVYKVDSSLEKVKDLEKTLQDAFRSGEVEGLKTYSLTVSPLKAISVGTAATPEATKEAEKPTEKPAEKTIEKAAETKAEEPKVETPKTEEPKAETPKAETPKAEEPKAETPPAVETLKVTALPVPQSFFVAFQEEGAAKTADAPPAETKTPEAKSAEPKAEEPKAEPAKEAPATEPSTTVPAVAAPPATGAEPEATAPKVKTEATVTLGGNSLVSAKVLENWLTTAAEVSIKRIPLIEVTAPKGGNAIEDSTQQSTWNVALGLSEADAKTVLDTMQATLEKTPFWQTSSEIGGQVSGGARFDALKAIVISLLGIVAYIWFRFQKLSWGIAAVVALIHDSLIMLGGIAASYWLVGALGFMQVEEFKISLPVVAAFLTLIGFSINDTIVIFDRIREVRGKSKELTPSMINDSVNQTLSRTVLTSGTVFITVVILYFIGGPGIHAFAFSLVIGVIAGTYSSIFIAAPLLLWMIGKDKNAV